MNAMICFRNRIAGFTLSAAMAVTGFSTAAHAQQTEPIVGRDGKLIYPADAEIPRNLTDVERRFIERHPLVSDRAVTPPPTGPLHCPAEYDPVDGILISWRGSSSWLNILAQMAKHITTTGNANVYLVVTASAQASALNAIQAQGADMSRVFPVIATTDTIWIRDYGPRYAYEGDCRVIIDHTYNRPRPNDDVLPVAFAQYKNHPRYEHQLVHGGGNYHLNSLGSGFATRLINNENPGLTEQQIIDIWKNYQNVTTTLFTPFPTSIDSTQHIDMWMQVIGDNEIVISDWPTQSGSTQDQICDNAAAWFANNGWTVHRTPAIHSGGTHYTYTNVVMCNDLLLLPSYTAISSTYNTQALNVWQAALPGKTIVQINCQPIVTSAGVMHCIVMHVPVHRGGENPTVYLKNHRGGETFSHGEYVQTKWIADDNRAVTAIDIQLSTDGGQTFPITIASGIENVGYHFWQVPNDINTAHGRVRVVAYDADGNSGYQSSETDIVIGNPDTPGAPGDATGDGVVNVEDLLAVIGAWGSCPAPPADCDADVAPYPDGDGIVNIDDLLAVISNWG